MRKLFFWRLLSIALMVAFYCGIVEAQNCSLDSQNPILLKGNNIVYKGRTIALNSHCVFVNGHLSEAEAKSPYVFRNFTEAMRHIEGVADQDAVSVYLAPYVYWVDNPDEPAVVTGEDGREPFGMTVRYRKLHFIGLNPQADRVVLASQRGQMQGAVGNFTMFRFMGDSLWVSNLTMGNYCNVDLDYPLLPSLSRNKRSKAITQAHVGYVRGAWMQARNVRFISRLNLNPLNGADRSEYLYCHFECTDDALNGTALYLHCNIDLYGQKPFWSTRGSGATFVDCDFNVKGESREMYFCKQGGPLTLIDCRYHAPEDTYLGWTAYPQPWLRCYQKNFTMNGQPYVIGNRQPTNTIVLPAHDDVIGPLFLDINRHEATITTGDKPLQITAGSSSDRIRWQLPDECRQYVRLSDETGSEITVTANNRTDEMAQFCLTAVAQDGRQAACYLTVKPSVLPPPTFARKPKIRIQGQRAWLEYSLRMQGATDCSSIVWYQDDVPIGVGNGMPLTDGQIGHAISARIQPRSSRSEPGQWVASTGVKPRIWSKQVRTSGEIHTDFSHFYCGWQPRVVPGLWTVDGFKPSDTASYPWSFDKQKPMWEYGEGFNGAIGKGLLQAQRGARIMYTPVEDTYGDMSLILRVDPTKTAGQGFGSATGQYMDVCLKYDTHSLTGYGLRIIRTVNNSKAVDFLLVAYDKGTIRPLTQAVTATCYRTGCTISLKVSGNRLTAHVETTTPQPPSSTLPHEVDLAAEIQPNPFGGVAIQHTGSCGESTTMLHQLDAYWGK